MNITPDIVCCEFIGTDAKIARATHSGNIGLCGRVVDETRNTFTLLHEGKKKIFIKGLSVFHFTFPDGTIVEVDGKLLVGRPEDRLKKTIRRLW